jgi:tyrosyl-tRNA synthetase
VTTFVHGEEGYKVALADTEKMFANQSAPVESLKVEYFETLQGVSRFGYALSRINEGVDVVSFLAETGIFSSKGDARKLIQGGGVSINRKKVEDIKLVIDQSILLQNKYILVQRGKSNHYLVTIA